MNLFRNLSIRTKLVGAALLTALFVVAVAIVGYINMQSVGEGMNAIYNDGLKPVDALGQVAAHVYQLRGEFYKYLLFPDQRAEQKQVIEDQIAAVNQQIEVYRQTPLSAEEKAALAKLDEAWGGYRQALNAAQAQVDAGNQQAALDSLSTGAVHTRRLVLDQTLGSMVEINKQTSESVHTTAEETMARALQILLVATIFAFLISIGLGFLSSSQIARNVETVATAAQSLAVGNLTQRVDVHTGDEIETLAHGFNTMAEKLQTMMEVERQAKETLQAAIREYVAFAKRVAQGDLTARLTAGGRDELGVLAENLNSMVDSLGELSGQVRQGSQGITAAATEILATVSQHTASANEQSAAVNQTTATVDELRASAEQTARQAGAVAQLAQTSAQVGQDGAQSVEAILRAMTDIRAKVEGIAQDILTLSEHTQQIGEIILTVNDIADQSNILALNAAIEAAKAGEQGKGFAVVAAEVRNLAEQSKQATAKVRTILGDIQKATNAAVLATEQGTRGVETGTGLAQRAGEVITRLAGDIRDAAQASQQIAGAAHQQSSAMDQIAQAMREIGQATVQFVAGARQSQSAAESLTNLSRQLQALTEKYKLAA